MSLVRGSCKDKDIKADIACLFHEYLTVKGLSRPPMFAFVWEPVRRNANEEYLYIRRVELEQQISLSSLAFVGENASVLVLKLIRLT